jgi:hypothetical protein
MNKKEILVSVFYLAEKGELSKTEQHEIISALESYGRSLNPNEVNQRFKNIRLGTRYILEQTEKCIDSALEGVNAFHKAIKDVMGADATLPKGALLGDDEETIKFIGSLELDVYNFYQAEKLIGISRQTLKKHADSGQFNLKVTRISKTDYITRENLIRYYREYNKKDGWGY